MRTTYDSISYIHCTFVYGQMAHLCVAHAVPTNDVVAHCVHCGEIIGVARKWLIYFYLFCISIFIIISILYINKYIYNWKCTNYEWLLAMNFVNFCGNVDVEKKKTTNVNRAMMMAMLMIIVVIKTIYMIYDIRWNRWIYIYIICVYIFT